MWFCFRVVFLVLDIELRIWVVYLVNEGSIGREVEEWDIKEKLVNKGCFIKVVIIEGIEV